MGLTHINIFLEIWSIFLCFEYTHTHESKEVLSTKTTPQNAHTDLVH